MKLINLLKKQEELDIKIHQAKNIDYDIQKVRLAFYVELGELANEWQMFKYWKENKNTNRAKMLEEYSDCLHFALSIENYYYKNIDDSIVQQGWLEYYKKLPLLVNIIEGGSVYDLYLKCFTQDYTILDILQLGVKLGFSLEEIENAYNTKNKINYDRLNNNY